ncbi:MAG: carboxylating nicotinate-nucleotide diphosphorylase [Bacteriovoracaceae bacterium]|nr:carboxylating nicotinate-nucleotide diphosphorylase [Bacteriovoracaceae bacterium]
MQDLIKSDVQQWLKEDGVEGYSSYWSTLPTVESQAELIIKSDTLLAGLPWFIAVFETLDPKLNLQSLLEFEGKFVKAGLKISLPTKLKWSVALTGERLALNLLHRACAVANATHELTSLAKPMGVKVLDTRKTTPGLRALEKYAVTIGGGENHRFTQTDAWMIKDNHKTLMGLKGAVEFFRNLSQPYKNIIVEIHDLKELATAQELGVKHFLLDNFSHDQLLKACEMKKENNFYEVSGGINKNTITNVLIKGVDAVSSGSITQFPASVDISFKFKPVSL